MVCSGAEFSQGEILIQHENLSDPMSPRGEPGSASEPAANIDLLAILLSRFFHSDAELVADLRLLGP